MGYLLGLTRSKSDFPPCKRDDKLPSYHVKERQNPPETLPSPTSLTPHRSSLLLVGVMTARHFLNTRAEAAFNTWVSSIPGRVIFFSSEGSEEDAPPGLPLVALPSVGDEYPPQKKSFAMFKYMYDFLLRDGYEYFMRVDDDIYVKGEELATFLRSVDSRVDRLIGQSGQGSSDPEVRRGFGLKYDENYCMGGTGVIMSASTLAAIGPHLTDCIHNLGSGHEDIEISRCVHQHTRQTCTWALDVSTN